MRSLDDYLADARQRIDRVLPEHLDDEIATGALVVDIRPEADRRFFGELEGAVAIDRNVLEWRLAPSSDARTFDVSDGRRVILFCNDGYASSLAAATLLDLGVSGACGLVDGYNAYRGAPGQYRVVTGRIGAMTGTLASRKRGFRHGPEPSSRPGYIRKTS